MVKGRKNSFKYIFSKVKEIPKPLLVRSKELSNKYVNKEDKISLNSFLLEYFEENYEGLEYDSEFLWNNYDKKGKEKLYCSEMITKLLNTKLESKMPTYPMTYDRAMDFWKTFFKTPIPEGKPGNNPGSFLKSGLFQIVE